MEEASERKNIQINEGRHSSEGRRKERGRGERRWRGERDGTVRREGLVEGERQEGRKDAGGKGGEQIERGKRGRDRGERERGESVVKAQVTQRHHRGLIKYGNSNC